MVHRTPGSYQDQGGHDTILAIKELHVKEQDAGLGQALKSLVSAAMGLNSVVPGITVVAAILAIPMVVLVLYAHFLLGAAALIILVVSIVVYGKTLSYGEAALALVVGLLTVFAVEWTAGRFVVFVCIWLGFTLLVFLVSSVRLASKQEEIYLQISQTLAGEDDDLTMGARVKEAAADADCLLDPIERAEASRVLAFRRLPVTSIGSALEATEKLSAVCKLEVVRVAAFVGDLYGLYDPQDQLEAQAIVGQAYARIRSCRTSPAAYIEAFDRSRRLVLLDEVEVEGFFKALSEGLDGGVAPDEMRDYIRSAVDGSTDAG